MVMSKRQSGLLALTVALCLLFMFMVTKIPALQLNYERYGDYFLPIVATVFMVTALIGANLSLKKIIPILLLFIFIMPLTNVTNGGWYNVPSTGLLFGTLFQFRPQRIHLRRNHIYLLGALFAIGVYFNLVPTLSQSDDGFNNKLWLYNFFTFLKFIYIALLFLQVQPSTKQIQKYATWFALFLASTVILETFHIPQINIPMKILAQVGYRPLEISISMATDYFRPAGLAIDPNQAAVRLAILLPIVLVQPRTFKWKIPIIAIMLAAVYLTGSRAGGIVTLVALATWFLYDWREFWYKYRSTFQASIIATVLILISTYNPSVAKVEEIATNRYNALVDREQQQTDKSFVFRESEMKLALQNITLTGDRTDHLTHVHSGVSRVMRFYGIVGSIVVASFWILYLLLVRKSYTITTIVLVIAISSLWKWTFQIDAFFVPPLVLAVLYFQEGKRGGREDTN